MFHSHIYIAGEDQGFHKGLKTALKKRGFEVTVVESGYPIAEMMDNWPDIFIIDIELPGINGIEICKWLKSHDDSKGIPVILVAGEPYLKILAATAQPDDYLEKPFTYSELLGKIKQMLLAEKME